MRIGLKLLLGLITLISVCHVGWGVLLVHRLAYNDGIVAFQNGSSARREEGAYLNRYATDEQRSRRSIFIATLWAVASWLFFRVARSSRIDLDMLVARALKNSQLTCGERYAISGTGR